MRLPYSVPDGLHRLAATRDGAAWLERVPHLLDRAQSRWRIDVGPPFWAGSAGWTALARRHGESAWTLVLKIAFPHPEGAGEADALLHWHGHGAPRLVEVDVEEWMLLMAAVRPGTAMSAGIWPPDRALRSGARVLADLHSVPLPAQHPFGDLAATVTWWRGLVAERAGAQEWAGADLDLVARWHELVTELLTTSTRQVLLHGDANPGNLLAGEEDHRVRWFAIDPKPVVGDPAFDPWPLIEQVDPNPFERVDTPEVLAERSRAVAGILNVPAWRIAGWSFARRVESALWLGSLVPQAEQPTRRLELLMEWQRAHAWDRAIEVLAD